MKKLIYISVLMAVLLAACGPKATPTMSPADVQATAFAAAATMIAQTQAAIPTATAVPPTETPVPTLPAPPTLEPLPTSSLPTLVPTPVPHTGSCNGLMDIGASGGKLTPVVFKNATKFNVTLTIGISSPNKFGQCGMIARALGKNATADVDVPYAFDGPCYWITAIIDPGGTHSKYVYGKAACINGTDKWVLEVTNDMVKVVTP